MIALLPLALFLCFPCAPTARRFCFSLLVLFNPFSQFFLLSRVHREQPPLFFPLGLLLTCFSVSRCVLLQITAALPTGLPWTFRHHAAISAHGLPCSVAPACSDS